MRLFLKILAVLILVATLAAAGLSTYAWVKRFPVCGGGTVQEIPAAEQAELLKTWLDEAEKNAFPGTVCYRSEEVPEADDSKFVQYTVRLVNSGFFPAEWISVSTENTEGDLMILGSGGANVLNAQSEGDMTLTMLCSSERSTDRELQVTCYVLGEKHTMILTAGSDGIKEKGETK